MKLQIEKIHAQALSQNCSSRVGAGGTVSARLQDARAVVQTMMAWLTEQGLEGRDVPEIVRGLGQRLRQLGLPVDRVGCAILALHPQIMSEEVAWDTESDDEFGGEHRMAGFSDKLDAYRLRL
jgi:hypothetical protein